MEPDYGPFNEVVALYKNYVKVDNPKSVEIDKTDPLCFCGVEMPNDYKKLTFGNMLEMASHKFGYFYFNILVKIEHEAHRQYVTGPNAGQPTTSAIYAQLALNDLAPEGKNLDSFAKEIRDIADITKNIRARNEQDIKNRKKQSAEPATSLPDTTKSGALDPRKLPKIDLKGVSSGESAIYNEQEALAVLASKTTLATDQSLKSPEISRAQDFVKSVKGIAA